ncbi:hypothetical protein HZH68_004798 [Vespula germanica]|uniref:Uncharacterized protein n=1 Tax=Vespula germanica TaxID=30212 RepID=A0A834NI94_VESGE|nr:hypothetical protein HZH68_004798 [Vespula germanica]
MLKQIDGPTETDRVTYVAGDEVTEFAMVPLNLRQVHFSYSSFRVSIGSRSVCKVYEIGVMIDNDDDDDDDDDDDNEDDDDDDDIDDDDDDDDVR